MKRVFRHFFAVALFAAAAVSCSKEEAPNVTNPDTEKPDTDDSEKSGMFIVVTEVDDAAYILTEESLIEGSTTIVGNGTEVQTASVWHYIGDKTLWSIKDVGGDYPAQVYGYQLDPKTKEIREAADFATTKYNSWGHFGDDFAYMAYLTNSSSAPTVEGEVYGQKVNYSAVSLTYTRSQGTTGQASFATTSAEGFLLNDKENPSPETVNFPGFTEAGGKIYVAIATQGVSKYATLQDNFESSMQTLIEAEGYEGKPSDYVANGSGIVYAIDKLTPGGTSGFSTSFKFANGVPFPLTPDKVRIAVYDADSFSIEKAPEAFISSDKMGQAFGRYYGNPYNTLVANDDYVYVFSPGSTRRYSDFYSVDINNGREELVAQYDVDSTTAADWTEDKKTTPLRKATSRAKAGVMRIKSGASSFDTSFGTDGLVALEEMLGGYTFTRVWHIEGDKFLLRVMSEGKTADGYYYGFHKSKPVDCHFAIFDASTQKISMISGLPKYAEIRDDNSAIGEPCSHDGKVYIPISKDSGSAVYVVDISSSNYAATEGITIKADNILGVGFLYE